MSKKCTRAKSGEQRNIQIATNRLENFDSTYRQAVANMSGQYHISPETNLSVDKNYDIRNLPDVDLFVSHSSGLIFSNEKVFTLMNSKKAVFATKAVWYQKNRHSVNLKTSYYCTSFEHNCPYITIVDNSSKFPAEMFFDYGKDISKMVQYEEPDDFSLSCVLMINGRPLFDYYRIDKNAERRPHHNRLRKDGTEVLKKFYPIYGSHEHQYNERFAVIYYDNKLCSYDAVQLVETSIADAKNVRLVNSQEAISKLENKLNVNLSLVSSGATLEEAYNNSQPNKFEYNEIKHLAKC